MRKLSLLQFIICCFAFCPATDLSAWLKKGDKCLKNFRYDEAIDYYKKVAARDTNDFLAWEKLGNAYLILNDYKNAESVYKVLAENPLANHLNKFYYGQCLRANGKYDEAQKAYVEFAKAMPSDSRAIEFKAFAEKVKPLLQDRKLFELSAFEQNSSASEIGAVYSGGKIIFSTNRNSNNPVKHVEEETAMPYFDLFEMNESDSTSPVKLKGNVNAKFNEGPATFSADGKQMIFTRTNYIKHGTDYILRLGLYHADFDSAKGWINIQPLNINSLTYNVAHPSLSTDGSRLFFVSDMPGGLGETDIYVSEKQDDKWGTPRNLGKEINTPGREMFPFIEDNNKLYFSTDSRLGLGGLDIFSAFQSNEFWVYVANLGTPVNTTADDFGYSTHPKGKKGFIISNRTGGAGEDDIYKFIRHDQEIFNLPNVYFDSSSYELRADAKVILDSVALVIKQHPTLVMELNGHTDSRGTNEFNIYLSHQRANACENYLSTVGVDRSRIITTGFGEEKLTNNCKEPDDCPDSEHQQNRRVEFKVIKF